MRWTTERPTKPGYYWFKDPGYYWFKDPRYYWFKDHPRIAYIVYVYISGTGMRVDNGKDMNDPIEDYKDGEWAGPIPKPTEPQEAR